MTMYPNEANQPAMFMYTWPDIRTLYSGVYAKDIYTLNKHHSLSVSTRLGFHNNTIASESGLESLQIFYPDMEDHNNRLLSSITTDYTIKKESYDLSLGLGYGERAPSVSEGYGFYIFNSFDNYDYIGNPQLKKEKAMEVNFTVNFHKEKFHIGLETSYFHLMDYIIGSIDKTLSPMTLGASGVRIYGALPYATIFDVYLNASYKLTHNFSLNGTIGYNYGKGSDQQNLPLIKPVSYMVEVNYFIPGFNAAVQLKGNGNQSHYSSFYGEDKTAAYAILNLNLGNSLVMNKNRLVLKYGIENMLNTHYSTYADWNSIPRQGRNFYVNVSYMFH